jgi:hypothetical protein
VKKLMRFGMIEVDDIFEVGCTSFYLLNKDLASVLIVRLGALNSRLKPGRFVAVRGLGAVILDRRKRQRLKMFSTTYIDHFGRICFQLGEFLR